MTFNIIYNWKRNYLGFLIYKLGSGNYVYLTNGIWLKNGNVSGLSKTDTTTFPKKFSVQSYHWEKRKRSDAALWQKPLHRQKNSKSNVTTQRTPPKTSITQRLRTDLGRSAGVTIAIQLVWLNRFTGSQPSH